MVGYIYKLENLSNGKVYIGQTRLTVDSRIKQHISSSQSPFVTSEFYLDLREFGVEGFSIETVEVVKRNELSDLIAELDKKEFEYINKFNSKENGYNISKGNYKNKKQKKYLRINLNILEEDKNTLLAKANESGKNITDYIVFKCLKEEVEHRPDKKMELMIDSNYKEMIEFRDKQISDLCKQNKELLEVLFEASQPKILSFIAFLFGRELWNPFKQIS